MSLHSRYWTTSSGWPSAYVCPFGWAAFFGLIFSSVAIAGSPCQKCGSNSTSGRRNHPRLRKKKPKEYQGTDLRLFPVDTAESEMAQAGVDHLRGSRSRAEPQAVVRCA